MEDGLTSTPTVRPDAMDGDLHKSLEQARRRFFVAVADVRPRLHRYCTRMTGSVLDGEDMVQETLAQAFYALAGLRETDRLEPWLFRIAHNKCVDFIRRSQRPTEEAEPYEDLMPAKEPDDAPLAGERVDEALLEVVTRLPPMERSCLLLKDVLDYSLTEIADVVDSTLGGVKAALHRARGKLRDQAPSHVALDLEPGERRLLEAYVDCFNRRDWKRLSDLIAADARLEIVGVTEGASPSTYFTNYERQPYEWHFELDLVDGVPMVVVWRRVGDGWRPATVVRLWWQGGRVIRIRDYAHVDYLLKHSSTIALPVATKGREE